MSNKRRCTIENYWHSITKTVGSWENALHKKVADSTTITEEILNEKLHFLCSDVVSTVPLYSKELKYQQDEIESYQLKLSLNLSP